MAMARSVQLDEALEWYLNKYHPRRNDPMIDHSLPFTKMADSLMELEKAVVERIWSNYLMIDIGDVPE